MNIWSFDCSRDAYDACQCLEAIKTGDILVIDEERVVGLADTWPIAVTAEAGGLHMAKEGRLKAYLAENKLDGGLAAAIWVARDRGWPLNKELI